jgi:hypothetical protein
MNSMLLLSALTFAQCEPPEYENIYFPGVIYTKEYVSAVMTDGTRTRVPVINGYLPTVESTRYPNGIQRNFYYHQGYKYGGESIVNYALPNTAVLRPPTVTEIREPNQDLVREVADLQKTVSELREMLKQKSELPKPELPKSNPSMKKPSEFDKESR